MKTGLLFLDTETTGLRPDIHAPWELGWVAALHDTSSEQLVLLHEYNECVELSYVANMRADDKALEIGGFEERYYGAKIDGQAHAISMLHWASTVLRAQADGDTVPHLVGAVPGFDHNMICSNWLGWPGFGEGWWHYHLIDVETLAAGAIKMPPPYSSDDICAAYNVKVSPEEKHTAMGDVRWSIRLYAAVYELAVVTKDGEPVEWV